MANFEFLLLHLHTRSILLQHDHAQRKQILEGVSEFGNALKYLFFCTAYLTARQKVKFAQYVLNTLQAEFVPQDIEALRCLLDSALTLIRAQYLGIKDEKRELFETMLAETRDDLRKENQAYSLLDKAHETNNLEHAEALVKQATELLPSIRQREYCLLGIRNAHIVIDGLPMEFSDEYRSTYRVYRKDALLPFTKNALAYLEETVLYGGYPDAEGLLYLACMYGCQKQFGDVILTLDKALTAKEGIQEVFRQPRLLKILLLACGSDRNKVEQVCRKLDIPSVTKENFCHFIVDFDLEGFTGYIQWIAVKKSNMPGEKGVHIIHICPPYVQNGGLVCAHSQVFQTGQIEGIPTDPQFVAVETLYETLCRSFLLVSSAM
jgi:hypothetical protein